MTWLVLAVLGCSGAGGGQETGLATDRPANVLLVLVDDWGTDQVGVYAEHPEPPKTPNIDALARRGTRFVNAYASPVCSPSRAQLLTGRAARRTGVGEVIQKTDGAQLPRAEVLLPEALAQLDVPYASGAYGKWHLAGVISPDGGRHPLVQGFDTHVGPVGNLLPSLTPEGRPASYFHYEQVRDGELEVVDGYATTETIDEAIAGVQTLREPWLVYVPLSAAHSPFHAPPESLLDAPLPADADDADLYAAMVHAVDREIGRLLDAMDPEVAERTLVIVAGDNGTPGAAVRPPRRADQAKQTLYEGGINVPLIAAGPGVAEGGESGALVHLMDVFPTVIELAGGAIEQLRTASGEPVNVDAVSLWPALEAPETASIRPWVAVERNGPVGPPPYVFDRVAVRDGRYKLVDIRVAGETTQLRLHDLMDRWDDGPNLLDGPLTTEAEAALLRLTEWAGAHRAIPYEGP